ncbi:MULTISPECIES: hypothetical protein [unclassified Rhizobium]|uniref:hypothetical protein n=1 Tax=unclassified Rhizobium TaxID=2613769 RepID=UPI00380BB62D
MGREVLIHAVAGPEAGEVRALLESDELILRGEIRRRYAKLQITSILSDGGILRFTYDGELVSLHLGERTAEAWRKAITTPSPNLRAKLGLAPDRNAFLIGAPVATELRDALAGAQAPEVHDAPMIIAVVCSLSDLSNALNAHSQAPHLPIWIVCRKGKGASVGSNDIRKALRSARLRDTKICSVSNDWTATRYISAEVS